MIKEKNLAKRKENWPKGNGGVIVDNFASLAISVGDEESEDDVDEESRLTDDVQQEKLPG